MHNKGGVAYSKVVVKIKIIRIMIARLKAIASNYSGLPAAENALAKIEELEKRLNRKKE